MSLEWGDKITRDENDGSIDLAALARIVQQGIESKSDSVEQAIAYELLCMRALMKVLSYRLIQRGFSNGDSIPEALDALFERWNATGGTVADSIPTEEMCKRSLSLWLQIAKEENKR